MWKTVLKHSEYLILWNLNNLWQIYKYFTNYSRFLKYYIYEALGEYLYNKLSLIDGFVVFIGHVREAWHCVTATQSNLWLFRLAFVFPL